MVLESKGHLYLHLKGLPDHLPSIEQLADSSLPPSSVLPSFPPSLTRRRLVHASVLHHLQLRKADLRLCSSGLITWSRQAEGVGGREGGREEEEKGG